ncbi:MAG: ATP-binding protein, partial [Polyangiales bacterium]
RSLRVFSRVERDHVELVRLDELVADACTMASNEIRHRARLVRELGVVPPIHADPGKLTQVAVNLLVNAAQAIPDHGGTDHRVTVRTWDDGDGVVLEVQDTGVGIPEHVRERIFEPFYTNKPRGQGTGLGLSLSLEIVRQHGGEMTVHDSPGGGSLFRVRFPRDTGLRPSHQPNSASLSQPPAKGRVLVIDDEQGLLRALRRVLRAEHDVVTATGGREALELLERDRGLDAVVCDLMMPDVDGVAVCEWLEKHAPELLARTALMSGGALTGRTRGFIDRTEIRLLEKPVPTDELKDVVRQLVSQSRDGSSDD